MLAGRIVHGLYRRCSASGPHKTYNHWVFRWSINITHIETFYLLIHRAKKVINSTVYMHLGTTQFYQGATYFCVIERQSVPILSRASRQRAKKS